MRKDFQAALDLLALAHSIEPMKWVWIGDRWSWGWAGACPLQHAARVLLGERPWVWAGFESAQALGIPSDTARVIMTAADHRYGDQERRRALLAVYGLSEPRA